MNIELARYYGLGQKAMVRMAWQNWQEDNNKYANVIFAKILLKLFDKCYFVLLGREKQ